MKIWLFILGTFLLGVSTPVKADRIDGHWCHGIQHLFIDGPNITTPSGTKMTGEYGRHTFRYIVPAGEPGAGATISMQQQHDKLVFVTSTASEGKVQSWIPCQMQTS